MEIIEEAKQRLKALKREALNKEKVENKTRKRRAQNKAARQARSNNRKYHS